MRKNIKRNQSIVIILTAILFTSIIAFESINSQQNGTILSIEEITIQPNKLKSAKVLVHNVENLGSFNFSVSYDSTILNVNEVDNCEMDQVFSYQNDATKGVLIILGINISAITTDEICIAKIEFKAVGSDGDSCDLIISDSELLTAETNGDDPIPISHEIVNG